jgi:hypothetical protein
MKPTPQMMGAAARKRAIGKLKTAPPAPPPPAASTPDDMDADVAANEVSAAPMTCPECGHSGDAMEFSGAPPPEAPPMGDEEF